MVGFFSFSNWIGSCSCAVCGRHRNTALKRCLKPALPYPILPLPPCLLGSRKPWAFLMDHSNRMSLGPPSPHQPLGTDHLILIKVLPIHHWAAGGFLCSPQVGRAGRNQGEDGSVEFSLWKLSQCGLGRTNLGCLGMAGSPPCSAITLCSGEFSFSEQTKPFCSF